MSTAVLDLLQAQTDKERPFEFDSFPIILKGSDLFKPEIFVDVPASVDPEPVAKQFRAIRRAGKWPTAMLRLANLEHRITSCLIHVLDHWPDEVFQRDAYLHIYMDEFHVDDRVITDCLKVRVVTVDGNHVKELAGLNIFKLRP
jgi:hypothetical protein